jgi:hypothetical protein
LHVHLLRTQARASSKGPPKKLLRSLAGLGGVSDATLAKQLDWIREHPEVLFATCISIFAHSDEATCTSLLCISPLSVPSCFVCLVRCSVPPGSSLGGQRGLMSRLGASASSWQTARPMISFPSLCMMHSMTSAGGLPTSCRLCATWLWSRVRGFMHTHAQQPL